MMERVKAPRSVFVNFPLGRPCGKPNNPHMQTEILKDALNFLESAKEPGEIIDLSHDWGGDFDWNDYMNNIKEMLEEDGSEKQEWKPEI
jgi:hypothetical protein